MAPTDRHLIVFAKAPRLGLAKTRLGADIGALRALQVYRALTARLIRRLGTDPRWTTLVAVAPDGARAVLGRGSDPWPATVGRMGQGSGGLGVRMERALAAPPPGPVVLVGTDSPALSPRHIEAAFRALGAADAVFGPAADGGFWLVGLKRRPFPHGLFGGVRLSTPYALEDSLANLLARPRIRDRAAIRLLERLEDLDTGADWERWRARFTAR